MMVFLVRRRVAESFEKKKETDKRKTLKNEQKEKRRMQGKSKSNNSNKYHYLSYKELIFARKYSLKKSSFCLHILITVLMRCRIFEIQ